MKPLCLISCPIDTFSGYGARSRDFVRALFKLKEKEWDIRIIPQRWGDCPWGALNDNDPLNYLITKKNNSQNNQIFGYKLLFLMNFNL